ncbi:MAG: hypothetical protein IT319_05835, partial [Anaerolineae bacterium]|nr:hypothetical protein [Anaerolineae bacterium]
MLPRNARPLFLLLLLLLFVAAPVMAAPVLTVTITHTGNAKAVYTNPAMSDFSTGSTSGQVVVSLTNTGDTPTAASLAFDVTLAGGLTFNSFVSSSTGMFSCAGATTVTCTASSALVNGSTETVTFTVSAPTQGNGPFTNS